MGQRPHVVNGEKWLTCAPAATINVHAQLWEPVMVLGTAARHSSLLLRRCSA